MATVPVLENQRVLRWFMNSLAVSGFFINRDKVAKRNVIATGVFSLSVLGVFFYSMVIFLNKMTTLAVLIHHSVLMMDVLITTTYMYFKRNVVRGLLTDMTKSFDYGSPTVSRFLDGLTKKRVLALEKAFKLISFVTVYMQVNLVIFGFAEKYTGNVEYVLLFPCYFPFDLSYLPYHILAFTWEHIVTESIGLTIYGVLSFIYVIYSHLTTQLVLLKFAIEKSKERAYELAAYSSENNQEEKDTFENRLRKCYIKGTTQCIKHHLAIIDYYMNAKDVFKIIYLLIFASGLIICTTTGFALISNNISLKIKFLGVISIQVVCLYFFCWSGEKICEEGESIRLSIYGTEWYDMPKECQVSFKLMVERSLKPLVFTTLTGQRVDLVSYTSMINASYSYFNLMLATQQRQ